MTEKGRPRHERANRSDFATGKARFALPGADEIVAHLAPELRSGDIVADV